MQPQSSEVTQTHSPMDGSPTSLPKYGWDSLNTPKTLKITCAINAEARTAEKNLPCPVQLVWHRKHQQGPYLSPSKHFNLKHTIPKDAPDTPAAGSSDSFPIPSLCFRAFVSLPCEARATQRHAGSHGADLIAAIDSFPDKRIHSRCTYAVNM